MEGRILLELKVPFGAASTKRQALRFLRSFVPLFASSIALLVLSVFVIYYHAANLVWIAKHDAPDLKHATGFELQFSGQIHKVTWLPTHLHKGPQYQLAVAAAATCLLAGIDIAVIYITARRVKQPFKRRTGYYLLAAAFLPAVVLTVTALIWNFVEWASANRVDVGLLWLQADRRLYTPYKGPWTDLEAWTCGVLPWVNRYYSYPPYVNVGDWRELSDTCYRATRGRWMLIPVTCLLLLTAFTGWFAFRAVDEQGRYERVDEAEDQSNGVRPSFEEGRVRLE